MKTKIAKIIVGVWAAVFVAVILLLFGLLAYYIPWVAIMLAGMGALMWALYILSCEEGDHWL